jgi:hypothetical protein
MTLEGTVVNGVVVFDGTARIPDGIRVRVDVELDEELPPDHPLAPYDRKTEIALLRERIAAADAGGPIIPLREAMAQIAMEMKLPKVAEA